MNGCYRYKLSSQASGPFKLVKASPEGGTLDIRRNNLDKRVNINLAEVERRPGKDQAGAANAVWQGRAALLEGKNSDFKAATH